MPLVTVPRVFAKVNSTSFLAVSKVANSPRSIYWNSNMTPRLSGHFSMFGLVFFVLKSLLGIARQWSRENLQF